MFNKFCPPMIKECPHTDRTFNAYIKSSSAEELVQFYNKTPCFENRKMHRKLVKAIQKKARAKRWRTNV